MPSQPQREFYLMCAALLGAWAIAALSLYWGA